MDRFHELLVFVRIVETGNLSTAARALGLSPSAVSKLVGRLEDRLGARLLQRTSRAVTPTAEGSAYYEMARRALEAADAADDAISAPGVRSAGTLRVQANLTFAKHQLVPVLPEFLERHPHVRVEFLLAPEPLDMLEHRLDVAIRLGRQRDSSLVARRIATTRRVICAAPQYLAKHGTPRRPADLARHDCLNFTRDSPAWVPWMVTERGRVHEVAVTGPVDTNQGEMLLALALAGVGIVRLAEFHVADALRTGALLRLLPGFQDETVDPIYALYSSRRHLSVRVRAFLDFLEAKFRRPGWAEQ